MEKYIHRSVPEYVTRDNHIAVLLKLMAIVQGDTNSKDEALLDLIDVEKCPVEYLGFLAYLVGYEMEETLDPNYQRMYIKRFLDTQRKRGTRQSIKNIAASFAQTEQSYRDTRLLNDIEVIEYGINDEGFNPGGSVWKPGTMFVKLRQGSQIVRDKITKVIPAGTRLIMGSIQDIELPVDHGPKIQSLYDTHISSSVIVFPPTTEFLTLDELRYRTIEQIHKMFQYTLGMSLTSHRQTNLVDSANALGYNERSSHLYSFIDDFAPVILTEQEMVTEVEMSLVNVFGFSLNKDSSTVKQLGPYTIDFLDKFKPYLKTECGLYLNATDIVNARVDTVSSNERTIITDLDVAKAAHFTRGADVTTEIELSKVITSFDNMFANRVEDISPYTIDRLEEFSLSRITKRASITTKKVDVGVKADAENSSELHLQLDTSTKVSTDGLYRIEEVSVACHEHTNSSIDRVRDLYGRRMNSFIPNLTGSDITYFYRNKEA